MSKTIEQVKELWEEILKQNKGPWRGWGSFVTLDELTKKELIKVVLEERTRCEALQEQLDEVLGK